MNGAECEFVHIDPLRELCYDRNSRNKYIGEELDINYRAGLEISRVGELSLKIPKDLPTKIDKPRPLPREGISRDVLARYNKLIKIHESLSPKGELHNKGNMDTMDDIQLLLQEGSGESSEIIIDYGRILEVKIFYSLGQCIPRVTQRA